MFSLKISGYHRIISRLLGFFFFFPTIAKAKNVNLQREGNGELRVSSPVIQALKCERTKNNKLYVKRKIREQSYNWSFDMSTEFSSQNV